MNTPLGEVSAGQIASALASGIKVVASTVTAFTVLIGVFWVLAQPWVREKTNEFLSPIVGQIEAVERRVQELDQTVKQLRQPFIEFKGRPEVLGDGPFSPGGTVPMLFKLQRNIPCSTTVVAQWINEETGDIDTSLTYRFPATRAPVTREFILFKANIRLPMDMPAGRWAYAPFLQPEDCNGYSEVQVPISEFFNVVR